MLPMACTGQVCQKASCEADALSELLQTFGVEGTEEELQRQFKNHPQKMIESDRPTVFGCFWMLFPQKPLLMSGQMGSFGMSKWAKSWTKPSQRS